VRVSESVCRTYVTWYNKLTSNWATWEPGEVVQPGAVGCFDREQRFTHYRTLADYRIAAEVATAESPVRNRLVYSDDDVHLDLKASGRSPAGFEALGTLDAGLKVTADREHACMLHMRDISEARIRNVDAVLQQIKDRLLRGEWEVDSVVVVRRLEVGQGFAAISSGSGLSFEAKADGDARLMGVADLGHAGFQLAPGRDRGSFLFYNFGPGSTPAFSSAIRVRRDLWDRLLPGRRDRGVLVGPDGRAYRALPEYLGDRALEARRYAPGKSPMSAGELSALAVEDLFEEVVDPPEEERGWRPPAGRVPEGAGGRLLSFPLPVPPGPAALAAADPAEGAPPVAEAASPNGLARFALFDRGDGEYWLEVSSVTPAEVPVITRLRYTATAQQPRELLVPVGDGPRSSSLVALRGYDGGPWRAWVPVPPASLWSGPADLVETSVQAALTTATVRTWERLASAMPEHGRKLITQAIEATR
jgi:hypothetical protein